MKTSKISRSREKIEFRKKNPINRYNNLTYCISKYKCKIILEVGTCQGTRARMMVKYALRLYSDPRIISYYGFDLFEAQSAEYKKKEFNGKVPADIAAVHKRLNPYRVKIRLYKGLSQITIPEFVKANPKLKIDLIFIDGGHSIETITTDWNNIQPLIHKNTCILFDDYWFNPKNNNKRDFAVAGCQTLIDNLDKSKWVVTDFGIVDKLKDMDITLPLVRPNLSPQPSPGQHDDDLKF